MDMRDLVNIIVYLLVAGGVCAVLWWLVTFAGSKGLPGIFVSIGQVVVAVIAVILLINLLLGLGGGTPYIRLR